MTTTRSSSAACLRLALCFAMLAGAALAAGQALAQDGKALDAPVAGQTQTPARAPAPAPAVTKASILRKGESSYYVLQSQGLKDFQCDIAPDWKSLINDPAQFALVSQIQYRAMIDAQGAVQVSPFLPNNATIDPSQDKVVSGLQQMISGFFQTWNSLVLTPIFSAADDDQLNYSAQPDGYHFAQKAGDSDVDIVMTADAVITTMKVTTADSIIVMHPKYTKTAGGLLLTSMNSDINNGTQKVNFQIQYAVIEGFALPEKASYQVTLPTETVSVNLDFADYKVDKNGL